MKYIWHGQLAAHIHIKKYALWQSNGQKQQSFINLGCVVVKYNLAYITCTFTYYTRGVIICCLQQLTLQLLYISV